MSGKMKRVKVADANEKPINRNLCSEIRLGMALTKTFLHMPLMGANPIGFK